MCVPVANRRNEDEDEDIKKQKHPAGGSAPPVEAAASPQTPPKLSVVPEPLADRLKRLRAEALPRATPDTPIKPAAVLKRLGRLLDAHHFGSEAVLVAAYQAFLANPWAREQCKPPCALDAFEGQWSRWVSEANLRRCFVAGCRGFEGAAWGDAPFCEQHQAECVASGQEPEAWIQAHGGAG